MSDSGKESDDVLTEEEMHALTQRPPVVRLSSYAESLSLKTRAFKVYLITVSLLGSAYLISYFIGALDTHLAYGWSKMRADYQLHQIRFVAGFFMLVSLHVWLLLRQPLETMLWSFIALQAYFQASGTAHLVTFDGAINDGWFMVIYSGIQSVFIVLLYLLIREERKSLRKMWQPQDPV